tara:strand:+ start:146 stop:334 length:189 start_codon:yes stop_codon:yes gene_type:complete
MKFSLELDHEPDFEERIMYMALSDLFELDLEFQGVEVALIGGKRNILCWLAFHILPMDIVEA